MKGGSFEWDDAKATGNYAKHGVSFEFARGVFKDAFAIERIDQRFSYEEERLVIIGMVEDHLPSVAYSARRAHSTNFCAAGHQG
jgi:uncharacterized DUF497 family protein